MSAFRKVEATLLASVFVFFSFRASSQVVINEIMYHGPANLAAEEFIELYNVGDEAVNLEGWQFTDGVSFVFQPGHRIEAGSFIVLCADAAAFSLLYPGVTNIAGNYAGRLDNGGERLTLRDAMAREVDSISYDDLHPWPTEPDGLGPSMELANPKLDNAAGENWRASLITGGTPGRQNSVFSLQYPLADAGPNQFVPEGESVGLDGAASRDPDGEVASFSWEQKAGPVVALHSNTTQTPYFVAPQVSENTTLTFELTVSDSDGLTSSATVQVLVIPIAGTKVTGAVEGKAVWKSDGSPYVITGAAVVGEKATLTIEPGATVHLFPDASVTVHGVLRAEGTEQNHVTFGAVPGIRATWKQFRFQESPGSVLQHCTFEHGSKPGSFSSSIPDRSAFYVTDSQLSVEHCTFRFIEDYVITAEDSEIEILDNWFQGTGEAINLTNCVATIYGNRIEGVRNGDDAIDINADWVHGYPTPVVIESNIILRSSGDGIDLGGCSPTISANLIYLCADKGISLGEASDPRIENNILLMNAMGIAIKDGSNPQIINNTVVGNRVGLSYYQKEASYGGGRGNVVNCIVWGNGEDVTYDALSLPRFSYCLVGGEFVWPGEGNMNENPLFLDPDRNDLRLTTESPAVNSATTRGCPQNDFAGEARPSGSAPDMGALEESNVPHDIDRDGVADDDDAFPLDARYVLDRDADTLPDEWEILFFGNTEAKPDEDPDAEGISNKEEYLRGTNPTSGAQAAVVINEIHYHPASENDAEEFIELFNQADTPADISGWEVTDEVLFRFPEGTLVPPKSYVVVAKEVEAIEAIHGLRNVYGPYVRSLSDAGGVVRLVDEQQVGICEVSYSDSPPWPSSADGDGPSLELKSPDLDSLSPPNWRSSWVVSGTPGRPNTSFEGPVVINEFMAIPILAEDWIELYNATDSQVDLSGYYVSDTLGNLTRYRIPDGTVVEGRDFLFITQTERGFGIGSEGETIVLTAPDGKTVQSQYSYSEQRPGVSMGRSPDGSEEWYSYLDGTPGEANSPPQVHGGVVINELHYHPLSDNDAEEFVEICNTTNETVDLSYWAFLDGFVYYLPLGTRLEPNGYLVIGNDPARVQQAFGISGVFGPFESGRLSNGGERVALYDVLGNLVDAVTYSDSGAWPYKPDGDGASLELINPEFDRTSPACWAASAEGPTPGWVNSTFSENIPPQVVSFVHYPTIPTSADSVLVQARIVDHDGSVASAEVFFKRDEDPTYASASMLVHQDSGIYWAVLPAQGSGTLVEFFFSVQDEEGAVTIVPRGAPGTVSAQTGGPVTISYTYLVDDSTYPSNLPAYRLLATEENLTELDSRPLTSDVILSGGFIYGDECFYDAGFRYREQSRQSKGIRIELFGHQSLHGDRAIRLSRYGAINETVSSIFYGRLGLPTYKTIDVRLLMNNEDYGYYIDAERIDEDFLSRCFPSDSDGNLVEPQSWDYRFELLEGDSTEGFARLWNETLWRYDEPAYPAFLESEIDIEEWIRWFAATAVLGDWDTILGPHSENHLEYERSSDSRVVIFSGDMDCTWLSPRLSIEEGTMGWIDPRVRNFLCYPLFRRQYYEEITSILDTEFLPEKLFPLMEYLCEKTEQPDWMIGRFTRYVTFRRPNLEDQIENSIALSDSFRPRIETNMGLCFFTEASVTTVSGTVVPGSAEVQVFKVERKPVEHVVNGGFEDGTIGWVTDESVPRISVAIDDSVSHTGDACMKVEILGANPDYYHTVQVVECEPLTQYRLSYCIKASGMVFGRMCVNVIDADNGKGYLSVDVPRERDRGPSPYYLNDCNWTQQQAVFKTKENTHRLAIRLARIPTPASYQTGDALGTVWYDDINLEKVHDGYTFLASASLDPGSGNWQVALPLDIGQNVWAFVCRPLEARPYLGKAEKLCIYRSEDSDRDGLPDIWEEEWFGSLKLGPESDPDGDTVATEIEFLRCLNPVSSDSDNDSISDDAELTFGLDASSNDAGGDLDGDGLTNIEEYLHYGTSPAASDTDGDGLLDGDEVLLHGTDPTLSDTDGDGQNDSNELYAGTDPSDSSSVFAFTSVKGENEGMRIRWTTVPGNRYKIHFSNDLKQWITLVNWAVAQGDSMEVTDTWKPSIRRRFYRAWILK